MGSDVVNELFIAQSEETKEFYGLGSDFVLFREL